MEYLLILNTFRIPRSSLDIQDGIYGLNSTETERDEPRSLQTQISQLL